VYCNNSQNFWHIHVTVANTGALETVVTYGNVGTLITKIPKITTKQCFDVSLTVHLSITLANDQLDAQIFNTSITILYMYMFGAISCSS
jgi:hypothetical protein